LTTKYKPTGGIIMTTLSINSALQMTLEDIQKLSLAELAELHNMCANSKQKKALRKADLIAGIIQAKKKTQAIEAQEEPKKEEPKAEPKQEELVLVENSVKTPEKKPFADNLKKAGIKLTGKPMPKVKPKQEEPKTEAKPKAIVKPKAEPKKEEPKKEEPKKEEPKPSFKRPENNAPDLTKMSKEELLKYVASLEQKAEKFPKVLDGNKTRYVRTEFENLKEIQAELISNPMHLYCFVDERLDEKQTQFLVLFASTEIVVLLDRSREVNTTITIETNKIQGATLQFPKDKNKYEFSFYVKEIK
jgi:hypothetical protein